MFVLVAAIDNRNTIMLDINKNILLMKSLVEEVEGSYAPQKLIGRTETEVANFSKTVKNINRALRDCGRFLESNALFSNY